MMTTMNRRRQWRDRQSPDIKDLTLAFCAGCGTGAICVLISFGFLWR